MAFADWLLPLLLLTSDDEHGRVPFDWCCTARPAVTTASRAARTHACRLTAPHGDPYRGLHLFGASMKRAWWAGPLLAVGTVSLGLFLSYLIAPRGGPLLTLLLLAALLSAWVGGLAVGLTATGLSVIGAVILPQIEGLATPNTAPPCSCGCWCLPWWARWCRPWLTVSAGSGSSSRTCVSSMRGLPRSCTRSGSGTGTATCRPSRCTGTRNARRTSACPPPPA